PEDAAVRLRVTHRPEGVCVSDTPGHGPIMPGGSDSAGPCGEHTVEADPAQRAADHGISHGTARMTLRAVITKRRSSPLPSSGTCGSVAIPVCLIERVLIDWRLVLEWIRALYLPAPHACCFHLGRRIKPQATDAAVEHDWYEPHRSAGVDDPAVIPLVRLPINVVATGCQAKRFAGRTAGGDLVVPVPQRLQFTDTVD